MDFTKIIAEFGAEFEKNPNRDLVLALVNFVGAMSIFWILKQLILKNARRVAKSTDWKFDDLVVGFLDALNWPFFIIFALKIALSFVKITTENNLSFGIQLVLFLQKLLGGVAIFLFAFYITKPLNELSIFIFKKWLRPNKSTNKDQKDEENVDSTLISLFDICLNAVLWSATFLFILQNFGVEISAVIGALGVSGIVVAFALQNVLADIFASLSIYLDRPFSVGDFIVTGTEMGSVEKIGIKSTRIKSLQGEEIILNNKTLIESRVHNYKRMENRRVAFNFSLIPTTSTENLRLVPKLIEDIIKTIEICRFDRAHFTSFGDQSLRFEVVYVIDSAEYNTFMDIQQKINLEIKTVFEENGIIVAVPLIYQGIEHLFTKN